MSESITRVCWPVTRTTDEEVLLDRDQADDAPVAGEAPQRGHQRLDVRRVVGRQLGDLPDALLAVGGEREVDRFGGRAGCGHAASVTREAPWGQRELRLGQPS